MTSPSVARLRRALTTICAFSIVWALLVTLTDGFVLHLFDLRISSRNPRNPALLALVSGLAAWALPMEDRRRATREFLARWRARLTWLSTRWPAWADAPGTLALVGAGFQIAAWISARPLWLDEQMIAVNVRGRHVAELAGPLWLDQTAPLGWLVLERVALLTLGAGERALRLVPMLFGVATLVTAAWMGRRWLRPIPAALFVGLCAIGPWLAYYPTELKHYSADAFWALLLTALAAWAMEGRAARHQVHRLRIWWAVAAAAHWFSNGGLLAVPACAAALLIPAWRSLKWRGIVEMGVGSMVLFASFALHFWLSIRYTLASQYLRDYWTGGFPPAAAGVLERLAWLGAQLQPVALIPAGTEHWALFWVVSLLGCLLARRPLRAMLFAFPITAFVLGTIGMVPLLDRVALWIVPVLYFGIASFAERAIGLLSGVGKRKRALPLLTAAAMLLVLVPLCADIVQRGWVAVEDRRVSTVNHGLNDRAALEWLMAQRQAGDVIVTTHLALPAVWWYAGIDLSGSTPPGSRQPDGSLIYEAELVPAAECDGARTSVLAMEHRALVYVGFPDAPAGFADLLVAHLGRLGTIKADRKFAESRAAVVDLTEASRVAPTPTDKLGCVTLQIARRW